MFILQWYLFSDSKYELTEIVGNSKIYVFCK